MKSKTEGLLKSKAPKVEASNSAEKTAIDENKITATKSMKEAAKGKAGDISEAVGVHITKVTKSKPGWQKQGHRIKIPKLVVKSAAKPVKADIAKVKKATLAKRKSGIKFTIARVRKSQIKFYN